MDVVQVVHRPRQPKATLRILMLKLVRVRGKHCKPQRPERKAPTGCRRVQKAEREERPAALRVTEHLSEQALPGAALVMLRVSGALEPSVHQPVAPVFGERRHHERAEKPDQPSHHERSFTLTSSRRHLKGARAPLGSAA